MNGLEFPTVFDAASNVVNHFTQRGTHWHFNQTHIVDFSGQGKHLGALRFFGANAAKPFRAFVDDRWNVGKGFHIVHVGGLSQVAFLRGEWWFESRFAAFAFHGMNKSRFFATNESARAIAYFDIEIEAGAQNIFAQQAIFAGLVERRFQPLNGQWILGPNVHQAFVGPNAIATNGHCFNHCVRVAFQNRPIHEGAGVALIGVADHVFLFIFLFPGDIPFQSRWEATAATSAQTRVHDYSNGFFGRQFVQTFA